MKPQNHNSKEHFIDINEMDEKAVVHELFHSIVREVRDEVRMSDTTTIKCCVLHKSHRALQELRRALQESRSMRRRRNCKFTKLGSCVILIGLLLFLLKTYF